MTTKIPDEMLVNPGGGGGGSASAFVDLTDKTSVDMASINAPLAASLGLKANLAAPVFTGVPQAPTAVAGNNTSQLATNAYVVNEREATATLKNKAISGTDNNITGLAGSAISTGTVAMARIITGGTPDGTKVLRDDGVVISIAGGGDALVANPLSQFAATSSAQLAGVLSDEVGSSGGFVRAGSPTLITPNIGVATATSVNKMAVTAPATSSTLAVADGKTLTASNTLTMTATDGSTAAFGAGGTVAYKGLKLDQFAATSSTELASILTDETGASGGFVRAVGPTIATPTLTGAVTAGGAQIITPAAMGALAIDTGSMANTKTISADVAPGAPFTFSGSPSTNQWFGMQLTNSDTAAHLISIPSCVDMISGLTVSGNAFLMPAGSQRDLLWKWDGTVYRFYNSTTTAGRIVTPVSAARTTTMADCNNEWTHPSADTTARVWTIDSNANVPYPIGTILVFSNQNAGGVITLAITSDTMYLLGTGTTGSRSIAANGCAIAKKVTSTVWQVGGVGVT